MLSLTIQKLVPDKQTNESFWILILLDRLLELIELNQVIELI